MATEYDFEKEYNEYKDKFNFCQYINEDKRCYEYNCEKHKNNIIKILEKEKGSNKVNFQCRFLLKKKIGNGYEECGRNNCKFHCIISDILKLPRAFLKAENIYLQNEYEIEQYSCAELVDFYNYSQDISVSSKEYYEKSVYFVRNLFEVYNKLDLEVCKYFIMCYLFHLFDTTNWRNLGNIKFKTALVGRIEYFSNHDHNEFTEYFKNTFIANINKKYVTKSKNKKYNIAIFKAAARLIIIYQKKLKQTYKVGGSLFLEIQKNFNNKKLVLNGKI